MSKLLTIWYRIFEYDEPSVEMALHGETHDQGGEILFIFEDGRELFVSWVNQPVQYAIGIKESTHYLPSANLTNFDVSSSAMWCDLVGHAVAFDFVATGNQILKVSSVTGHTFICSFRDGGWFCDAMTICKEAPDL